MKSDSELANMIANGPKPGSLWRHYKWGTLYEVVTCAIEEGTLRCVVVYREVHGLVTFTRPVEEWTEIVERHAGCQEYVRHHRFTAFTGDDLKRWS